MSVYQYERWNNGEKSYSKIKQWFKAGNDYAYIDLIFFGWWHQLFYILNRRLTFLIDWRPSIHPIGIRHYDSIILCDSKDAMDVVAKEKFKTEGNVDMVEIELLLVVELKN